MPRHGGRCGLLTILALLLAAAPAAAAKKPALKVTAEPATLAPGGKLTVRGRVTGKKPTFKRSLRVVLVEKVGRRWVRRAAVRPTRKLAFAVRWRVPRAVKQRSL